MPAIIAREAGFSAPDAKILVTPVDLVQPEEKLVREKLCPVLGFARVSNIDQAISSARSMMRVIRRRPFGGDPLPAPRPTSWPSPPPCPRCASR